MKPSRAQTDETASNQALARAKAFEWRLRGPKISRRLAGCGGVAARSDSVILATPAERREGFPRTRRLHRLRLRPHWRMTR
jgi:hypothetical protein